jgi:hypothetical protein
MDHVTVREDEPVWGNHKTGAGAARFRSVAPGAVVVQSADIHYGWPDFFHYSRHRPGVAVQQLVIAYGRLVEQIGLNGAALAKCPDEYDVRSLLKDIWDVHDFVPVF